MNYKIKHNLLQTMIFICLWFFDNGKYINLKSKISDASNFLKLFNVSAGYNDSVFRVGIVLTIMFAISYLAYFKTPSNQSILRRGRSGFVAFDAKQTIAYAFLFSFEYWMVNELLTIIFVNISVLNEQKFFHCSILYFLVRLSYFALFSTMLLASKYLSCFRKYYVYFATLMLLAINSLPYLMIDKGIIMYANFVKEWVIFGRFNHSEYIQNLLICVAVCVVLSVASKILFLKRDILIDEKENI